MPIARRVTGCSALLLAACAGTSTEPGAFEVEQSRAALASAERDTEHSGVLAIVTVTPETVELCTGTLLAPNLVLTARHCVAPTATETLDCDETVFGDTLPPESVWVNRSGVLSGPLFSFGLLGVLGGGEEFVAVARVHVPPGDTVCGGDVALLLLDESLEESDAEPIAPRLYGGAIAGEPYTAVGFGATPSVDEQGTRRSRSDVAVECGLEACEGARVSGATEFVGGDGVCSGDSGGPALTPDGRVFGVASRANLCEASVYSAVSAWQDWLRVLATDAADRGQYPLPDWVSEPPPKPESPTQPPPATTDEPSMPIGDEDVGDDSDDSDGGEDQMGDDGSTEADVEDSASDVDRAPLTPREASTDESTCALGGAAAPSPANALSWLGVGAVWALRRWFRALRRASSV